MRLPMRFLVVAGLVALGPSSGWTLAMDQAPGHAGQGTTGATGAKVQAPSAAAPATAAKPAAAPSTSSAPATSQTWATAADQKAIDAQKTCPVSGEELGSMGRPLKVTRGDKSIFLCCQGCLKTVYADPNKYLGAPKAIAAAPPSAKPARTPAAPTTAPAITLAWATAADQKTINTQRTCPVSKETLGSMGAPVKVTRAGKTVLVCCQSCLKTIYANPDKYLGAAD